MSKATKNTRDFASEQPHPGEQESRDWTRHEHVTPAVQNEAQRLVEHSGSPEAAKHAIDSAAEQPEAVAASAKDAFARRHGFTSYLELFEASSVVRSVDGKNWCVTALPAQQWMVWNEQDLTAHALRGSMEEARRSIPEE